MGSAHKEAAPIGGGLPEIKPSLGNNTPEVSPDLREMGIEVNQEHPSLTFEHKEAGIDHAGVSIPVQTAPTGTVNIMTPTEIAENLRGDDTDSKTGLARLLTKIRKIAGLSE